MIPFVKMHGLGNDFVFLDALGPSGRDVGTGEDLPALARAMCDRRLGIGADQLLRIEPPTDAARVAGAALRMRVWNADGGTSEMCGNGIRCAVKLAIERGHVAARDGAVIVETGAGLLRCEPHVGAGGAIDRVTVEMGSPRFGPEAVGAVASRLRPGARSEEWGVGEVEGALVSVGNPHLVVFTTQALEGVDLARIGPLLERDPAFPARINAHFVRVVEPGLAVVRTWERGAGMTSACGTGACAALAAGVRTGRLARDCVVRLPGGDLRVRWDERTDRLHKTGPATLVFTGEWPS